MFGIRPAEMISDFLDEMEERKAEKRKEKKNRHIYNEETVIQEDKKSRKISLGEF